MPHFTSLLYLITFWVAAGSGYKLEFYTGPRCSSSHLGTRVLGPDQGCRTDFIGQGQSMTVESTGPVDDPFMLVLFSSDDCNPDTIIDHADHYCADNDDNPEGGHYLSYQVWNVMEDY